MSHNYVGITECNSAENCVTEGMCLPVCNYMLFAKNPVGKSKKIHSFVDAFHSVNYALVMFLKYMYMDIPPSEEMSVLILFQTD